MSYAIILPENIQKSLNKLPEKTKIRIVQKLYDIRDDPFRYVIPVKGSDYHRLRVGNFRIIMSIERCKLIIIVMKIDNRDRLYDHLN